MGWEPEGLGIQKLHVLYVAMNKISTEEISNTRKYLYDTHTDYS